MKGVATKRPTPENQLKDTRCTNLSQILDVDEEVVKQAEQTKITAMMDQENEDAADV